MSSEATRALVLAAWQDGWNRSFRFSRWKLGLWLALLQVGAGAAVLWRLGGVQMAGEGSLGSAMGLMLAQSGVWSFVIGFLGGRQRLFGGRAATLLHVSPAPAISPVVAEVAGHLPRKAWSMVLWAAGLGLMLPQAQWPWAMPVLWAAGLVVGLLGEFGGLMALLAWARLAPRLLGGVWSALLAAQVVAIWYGVFLLARGVSPEALQAAAGALRWGLGGALAALLGLPGLVMVGMLAVARGRLGEVYREGWLRLAEVGDAGARARRSRWPAPGGGAWAAVAAKEWLMAGRNPITWFRLAGLALLTLTLFAFRAEVGALAARYHDWVVLGAGAGLVLFAFGEQAAAGFSADGARLGLYATAGVGARHLLAGKVLGMAPLAVLGGACSWAVALAAGVGAAGQARAAMAGALLVLGAVCVAVGGASLDAAVRDPEEEPDLQALAALMEQVPRGAGGTTGLIGSMVYGGFGVWALGWGAGSGAEVGPGWAVSPALVIILAVLPLLALLPGYIRLRNLLARG